MPMDNYGDSDGDESTPSKAPAKEQEDEGEALLPKSFFGGDVKPGHRCMVEVTHCGEDECVVKYVGEKNEEDEGSEMERSNSKLSSMATEAGDY